MKSMQQYNLPVSLQCTAGCGVNWIGCQTCEEAARFFLGGGSSVVFAFLLAGASRPEGAASSLLRLPSLWSMSLAIGLVILPLGCADSAFCLCAASRS